ncbi:Uncharacterised protein [Mycobacteroides abscessus]|nr:Uncharacterised protein [Mycobacteroides abscessus]
MTSTVSCGVPVHVPSSSALNVSWCSLSSRSSSRSMFAATVRSRVVRSVVVRRATRTAASCICSNVRCSDGSIARPG